MEKINKIKNFLKEKKKQVEKIIEAPEKQRKIDKLEKENDRLRGWSILGKKNDDNF